MNRCHTTPFVQTSSMPETVKPHDWPLGKGRRVGGRSALGDSPVSDGDPFFAEEGFVPVFEAGDQSARGGDDPPPGEAIALAEVVSDGASSARAAGLGGDFAVGDHFSGLEG